MVHPHETSVPSKRNCSTVNETSGPLDFASPSRHACARPAKNIQKAACSIRLQSARGKDARIYECPHTAQLLLPSRSFWTFSKSVNHQHARTDKSVTQPDRSPPPLRSFWLPVGVTHPAVVFSVVGFCFVLFCFVCSFA